MREREKSIEQGGLSGKPLFPLSTRMLAETYVRLEGAMPIIGVGGIDSGDAAIAKLRAGAALVQLYSGLVFHGLALVREIKRAMLKQAEKAAAGGACRCRCRRYHRAAMAGVTVAWRRLQQTPFIPA